MLFLMWCRGRETKKNIFSFSTEGKGPSYWKTRGPDVVWLTTNFKNLSPIFYWNRKKRRVIFKPYLLGSFLKMGFMPEVVQVFCTSFFVCCQKPKEKKKSWKKRKSEPQKTRIVFYMQKREKKRIMCVGFIWESFRFSCVYRSFSRYKKKKAEGNCDCYYFFCFVFVFISRKIVPVQNNKHESPTTHTKKIAKQN